MTRGSAVLPQGAAEFLRSRLTEGIGLALIAAAAAYVGTKTVNAMNAR